MKWREIKEFEGIYLISDKGNIYSKKSNKELKPYKSNNGYLMVRLYKNKTKKDYLVHRLVAEAFIPNPNNYRCVNHKDELKTNNHVSNLEWCTYAYNNSYGTRKERESKTRTKKIIQKDKMGNFIKKWESTKEIVLNNNGYTKTSINKCCRGVLKTYKKFIWEYIKE